MGYNTTVNIINDGLDQLRKYPEEFVEGIVRNLNSGGIFGVGNHANQVEVARSEHADTFMLYAVHGNSLIALSPWSLVTRDIAESNPELVKDLIHRAKAYLDYLESELDIP